MEHDVELGMTLYDMNKSIMLNEKKLTNQKMNQKMKELTEYFANGTYFMMLCHEMRDYTIFQLTSKNNAKVAAEELRECLNNRGEVLSIEKEGPAYEIWLRCFVDREAAEGNVYAYYLFPYDEAVIIC